IEYLKKTLNQENGKVITTDCDINAPSIYFSDKFEIVPKINHPDYVEIIIEICKKHDIQAIFSLIDPELELLARNKEKFDKENVQLILSDEKTIDICFDKYKTSIYLDNNAIQSVPTYRDLTIVQK